MLLRVAQEVHDTEAEGPGRRYAFWVQGCSLRCPGCCNPEMFVEGKGGTLIESTELAARIIATQGLEGISVLGGEPFEQAEGVAIVAERVQAAGMSVMIYSGYTRAELELRAVTAVCVQRLLDACDVLVDGRYEQSLPETKRRWLGSSNQVMHFLTPRYSPTDARFSTVNTVELRYEKGVLTLNGWPAAADAARPTTHRKGL